MDGEDMHRTYWPAVLCNEQAVFFERAEDFGVAYFGGPLEHRFVGQAFGTEPLHRVMTLSMDKLPTPKGYKAIGDLPLFYGFRYEGCRIRYRPTVEGSPDYQMFSHSDVSEVIGISPNRSTQGWPYEDYPRILPYVPLRVAQRVPMAVADFERQMTWQGLHMSETELAVVVPANPLLGCSMWGRVGDRAEVMLVFKYDFVSHEVIAESQVG
ncbi:MAG: hypothetical protein JXB07_20170 [Anaerolineae bacterium]|nr:hypothetical protein [Anaerolineae bacterium]